MSFPTDLIFSSQRQFKRRQMVFYDTIHIALTLSTVILSVCVQNHFTEYLYVKCRYGECCGKVKSMPIVIMLCPYSYCLNAEYRYSECLCSVPFYRVSLC